MTRRSRQCPGRGTRRRRRASTPTRGRRAPARQDRHSLAPAERAAFGAARGACGLGSGEPARDAPLQHPDAARHADDHRRACRHAGIGLAGDRAGCRRRFRPEDVAGTRIRHRDLAGAQATKHRSPGPRTGARISSPASTAATSTFRSKARSMLMPDCWRCRRTSSPMSGPIPATRRPAASSR